MSGISSKALKSNYSENKYKYNGIEQNNDFDINIYDAFYRNLDPQIGRFWQIDPQSDILQDYSPYETMGNNPISNEDPFGDYKHWFGAWWHSLWNGGGDVRKNTDGEWFVSKTSFSTSADGTVTATARVSYGKGRNENSTAKEEALAYLESQENLEYLVRNGAAERHNTVEEANEATFKNSVYLLLPNLLKGTTNIVNAEKVVEESTSTISKVIDAGKQGKHIVGHNNYQAGKSILTEDAQGLLDAFHSGKVKSIQTINQVKTRVDFGKTIGTYINPQTKQAISTTRGIIVNSKNGVHIIPSAPL